MSIQQCISKMAIFNIVVFALSACGGSSGSSEQIKNEPRQITSTNWNSPNLNNRNVTVEVTDYLSASKTWTIVINDDDLTSNNHIQVYLDTDNNPATGYQFDGSVWTQNSGADYLIEDETLYQSTRNDSSWSWKTIENVTVERTRQNIKISVHVTSLSGLCKDYNIGIIGLSNGWDIEAYYPQSNSMASRKIDYCDTTIQNNRPKITLNDYSPLVIQRDSVFIVPQATAFDAEDGDISNSITNTHNVDEKKPGNYEVTYSVKDSEGLYAIPIIKQVIVANPLSDFTIDGLTSDWDTINTFAVSNGKTLKISDNQTDFFMLIKANTIGENTQFYIDSDNNSSTGFDNANGGIDFLLENANLYKFTGINGNHWSWDLVDTSIAQVKNQNVVELSIPKVAFGTLVNSFKLSFSSLDKNWNQLYTLPTSVKEYSFQGSGTTNHAPDAVEDAVETTLNAPLEIDVLANDTDQDRDPLSIVSFTQPSLGITTQLANGNILFNPQGKIGSISFSYTISDGKGGTDTAVVTIATYDPNDPAHSGWPIIVDENITVHSGQTILIDVLANDSDPDGDTLILDQVDDPAHGVTTKINGKVQYTANVGHTGPDIFWYGVHDGYGHNGAGKVMITIIP